MGAIFGLFAALAAVIPGTYLLAATALGGIAACFGPELLTAAQASWEGIQAGFSALIQWFGQSFPTTAFYISETCKNMGTNIHGIATDIGNAFSTAWQGISAAGTTLWGSLKTDCTAAFSAISSQEVTEDLLKDAETDEPVVNPNGERIQIEIPNSYPVIEFSRYEPSPDTPAGIAAFISKMNRFKNRINSDEFMGFEPGTCFLYAPQTTREQINGGYFFKVTYRILIKADEGEEPFKAKPLCEGYMAKNPDAGGTVQSTSEIYGQNIKVNLDAFGMPLGEDADPVFLSFNQYKSVNFSELQLLPEE